MSGALALVEAFLAGYRLGVQATTAAPETPQQPSFRCPQCGARSYHPEDLRHGYCGRCYAFTGGSTPGPVS